MLNRRYLAVRTTLERIIIAHRASMPMWSLIASGLVVVCVIVFGLAWVRFSPFADCPPICVTLPAQMAQLLDPSESNSTTLFSPDQSTVQRYPPTVGQICWADRIEDYGSWAGIGIVAQFGTPTAELTFVNGTCNDGTQTLDNVLAQLRRDRPDTQWVVVPEFANIASQSPAVPRVRRIDTPQSVTVTTGDICWGRLGSWGTPGHGIIAAFTAPTTLTMTDVACESNGRSLNDIGAWVQQTQTAWQWSVVPDFAQVETMQDELPEYWQSERAGTYAAHAGEICWGARLNSWGADQTPIVVAFSQATDIQYGWMGCERNGRSLEQIFQAQQQQAPQLAWQMVPDFAQIANQTPVVPSQWQSTSITTYAPRANEICWGTQIDGRGSENQPVLVQFTRDTTALSFTEGGCEYNGRSLADIQSWLMAQRQQNWSIIPDFVPSQATQVATESTALIPTLAPLPQSARWESGPGTGTYAPQAGDICWGTFIDQYGGYGIPIVTAFPEANAPVTITAGACERNIDSFAATVARLRQEFPQLAWQEVPDFRQIANTAVATQWTVTQQTSTVFAGDVCWGYQIGRSNNDNWGLTVNPIVTQFQSNQTNLYMGWATCERGGRTLAQIYAAVQADATLKPVLVPDFATIEQQVPPVSRWWASGARSATFAPRAGTICWGARVGVLSNSQQRILVQFTKDTPALDVVNGACEFGGRDLESIKAQLFRDLPDDPQNPNDDWWVVGDYAVYGD